MNKWLTVAGSKDLRGSARNRNALCRKR